MDKSAIALPEAYRNVNYQYVCLREGKIEAIGKTGVTYLTTQELVCLRFFLQGASYK